MNPEEHQILERLLHLEEQNHRILRSLHRSMVWGTIFQIIYWLFILGVAVGAYYFVRPYLGPFGQLLDKLSQVTGIKF